MKKSKTLFIMTCLLLVAAFWGAPGSSLQAADELLFTAAGNVNVDKDFSGPEIFRTRFVNVNIDMINGNGPDRLMINLYDDVIVEAVLTRIEHVTKDTTSWVGTVVGEEYSEVILVKGNNILIGYVRTLDASYEILYVKDSIHVINDLNTAAFPPPSEPLIAGNPPGPALDVPLTEADSGEVVSVLVVYTTAAKNGAGGSAAISNLISLAISQSNASLNNSNVDLQFTLAHKQEITYNEANFDWSQTIERLQKTNDGFMDSVHNIRSTYNADVVVLLVDHQSNTLGIGYVMQNVNAGFKPWAFSVVSRRAVSGQMTFHHEIGHNMGCAHDRANAGVDGAYSYSYGYWASDMSFRTVMAYNCPGGCPRINYWSNPNVSYNGLVTGIAHTASDSADNARTLTNTKFTTANFFQTTNSPPSFNTVHGTVSVREGATLTLDCSATDANGDSITYSRGGLPAGATFGIDTAQFTWTPTYTQGRAATYNIVIYASDSQLSASQVIKISVVNVKKITK